MYQSITLIGNLTRDVELRYTPSGVPVAKMSVAVNKQWTDSNGQKQEKVTYFDVTVWRKQAETVAQYLAKGRKVLVVGEVDEARPWTDKQGNNRASLEVTGHTVKFLGSRNDNDNAALPESVEDEPSIPF